MPKVSIIVPIYKVEPYLKRCIDSLTSQTLSDLEIILVLIQNQIGLFLADFFGMAHQIRMIGKDEIRKFDSDVPQPHKIKPVKCAFIGQ